MESELLNVVKCACTKHYLSSVHSYLHLFSKCYIHSILLMQTNLNCHEIFNSPSWFIFNFNNLI